MEQPTKKEIETQIGTIKAAVYDISCDFYTRSPRGVSTVINELQKLEKMLVDICN